MGHVQIYHGNWQPWVVQPAEAGRVGDQIKYYVQRGDRIDKSIVIRWTYVKELAMMNTGERGEIEFIRLYTKGKHSKGRREESVYGQKNKRNM